VVVISGDVAFDQAVALAKKYLEPIPRQDPPPKVRTVEPVQQGERRVVVRKPAQLPVLMLSYHTPATSAPETPALDLLEAILTDGRSSRLYQRLIDKDQLAITVEARREFSLDPGQFGFFVQPKNGVALDRVERAIYEELDRVAKAGVTNDELSKAKTQLLTAHYRNLKTISGKANQLGRFEIYYGSTDRVFSMPGEWEKVAAGDVQKVAQRFFTPLNRTVATLIPEVSE
jgi:zinc protease